MVHGSYSMNHTEQSFQFLLVPGSRIGVLQVLFWSLLVVTVINMVMPHHCWGYWSKFWLFTFGRRHFLNSLTVSCHHLYATFGNFRQFWQPLTTFGNSQHLLVTLGNHWQLMATGGLLVQILIVNIWSLTFSKLTHCLILLRKVFLCHQTSREVIRGQILCIPVCLWRLQKS